MAVKSSYREAAGKQPSLQSPTPINTPPERLKNKFYDGREDFPYKNMTTCLTTTEKRRSRKMWHNLEEIKVTFADIEIKSPLKKPFYTVEFKDPPEPKKLAYTAKLLLERLKQDFPSKRPVLDYRLSYVLVNNTMLLKIPAKQWFDDFFVEKTGLEKYEIATSWIDSVTKQEKETPRHFTLSEAPTQIHVTRQYCRTGVDCRDWKACKWNHTFDTCAQVVNSRDGSTHCNHAVFWELIIPFPPGIDPRFAVQVRNDEDISRDLLIYPYPSAFFKDGNKIYGGADTWRGHYTNEELVKTEEIWQASFETVEQLKEYAKKSTRSCAGPIVSEIAFNFGKWESKMSNDKKALECHGHGHILLTEDGQIALANCTEIVTKSYFPDGEKNTTTSGHTLLVDARTLFLMTSMTLKSYKLLEYRHLAFKCYMKKWRKLKKRWRALERT